MVFDSGSKLHYLYSVYVLGGLWFFSRLYKDALDRLTQLLSISSGTYFCSGFLSYSHYTAWLRKCSILVMDDWLTFMVYVLCCSKKLVVQILRCLALKYAYKNLLILLYIPQFLLLYRLFRKSMLRWNVLALATYWWGIFKY